MLIIVLAPRRASSLQDLQVSVRRKRDVGLHFVSAETWDLFVIAFKEAHCASHAFWDFEPNHPAYDAARATRLENPIHIILKDIDEAIGRLVMAAGPDADVLVFSTSEFQPNRGINHLIRDLVKQLNIRLAAHRWGKLAPLARHIPMPGEAMWQCADMPYNENCVALRINQTPRGDFMPAAAPPPTQDLKFLAAELRALRDADSDSAIVSAITFPSSAY